MVLTILEFEVLIKALDFRTAVRSIFMNFKAQKEKCNFISYELFLNP